MLYREITAVCSQIHRKHINTLCGQNVEFVTVKLGGKYSDHCAVHTVTTGCRELMVYRGLAGDKEYNPDIFLADMNGTAKLSSVEPSNCCHSILYGSLLLIEVIINRK
jgi:hypothetical protein